MKDLVEQANIQPIYPPAWLRNNHAQTIYNVYFGDVPKPPFRRERIDTPDGDFLDLDWIDGKEEAPLVIACHGLEGCSRAKYMVRLMRKVHEAGWNGISMNFRGCSGEPNRLPRAYHSGETGDLDLVIRTVIQRNPNVKIFLAGFSLGANVMCKWLGEQGGEVPKNIAAACSCSAPYQLHESQKIMDSGFCRVYVEYFLRSLRKKIRQKASAFPNTFDAKRASRSFSFQTFDDSYTGPVHGFKDYVDYYTQSSSYPYLPLIRVPTLLIHALDDPFTAVEHLPTRETVENDHLHYFYQPHGGHLGFYDRTEKTYWLSNQVVRWFQYVHCLNRNFQNNGNG